MEQVEWHMMQHVSLGVLFQPVVYAPAPEGLLPIGPVRAIGYEPAMGPWHEPGFINLIEYEDHRMYMAPGQPTWHEHVVRMFQKEQAIWENMDDPPGGAQAQGNGEQDGADAEMDAADEEVPAHPAAPAAQQIGAAPAEAAAAANVAAHQAAAQQAAAQQALLVQQVAQLQLHMQEAQPAAQQLQA